MRYLHVISAFAGELWAMDPAKLEAITSFLAFKAGGGMLSSDEIEARISDTRMRDTARAEGGVAVLPMVGIISPRAAMMADVSGGGAGTSTDAFSAMLRSALNNDQVKAIVIDVHSPGGSPYGVSELAAEIRDAKGTKPIIAQINSQAASAAYWAISGADEIAVTPGGEGGSLGVYGVHEDVSQKLENDGIKPTLIRGDKGIYKAETSGLKPLSKEAHDYQQQRINDTEDAFHKSVALGRKVTQTHVAENFGKGRMFGADELVKRGMADRISTMGETLARLGVTPPKGGAAARSRQAFVRGETPSLALIEEVLREADFPNALATNFVSLGKGALRSESGPGETKTLSPEAKASLAEFMARLGA